MKQKVFCVIMGGGRGTRLHPLTQQRCKPAVPLAGKFRLVDIPISNCLNSGFNKIHILSQFNTASLHNHIQQAYQFDPFGGGYVEILSAEQTETGEQWYQGTADAVRQNLHHFGASDNDLFLILSGDQLYRMDFRKIVNQHKVIGSDVTVAAKVVSKAEVSGLGVMRVSDDFSIQEFVEKPQDPAVVDSLVISKTLKQGLKEASAADYCLASMGIYVFSAKVLREALNNNSADFGKEIIPGLLGAHKLSSYIFDGYWEDIGTVGAFFEANLGLTDPVPPFNFFDEENPIYTRARYLCATKVNGCTMEKAIIAGGCIIEPSTISRAVIGVRSSIGKGCELESVVMMGADFIETEEELAHNRASKVPHIGIGENCKISNAIIDKNARIGNNVVLSPVGKPDMWNNDGLYVRDGVLIVKKDAVILDGTEC